MMKGKFSALLTIFFFFLILLFPKICVTGAGKGLVLWFHTVLPTLLPFLILTNLLLETGAIHLLSKLTKPLFCRIFHVSEYGSIVILSGFLCGYPLGSKFTADLLCRQKISYREASYLLSFCNNTSPMFIISFFIQQNLNTPALTLPTLGILIGSPVLCSFLFRKELIVYGEGHSTATPSRIKQETNGGLFDDCIMNGFETITKIGGYMMLFTILIELGSLLPFENPDLSPLLLSPLEMTTGIVSICQSSLAFCWKYIFSLALISFGGFCCLVQTASMLQGSGLSIVPYITQKLITAVVTSLLALCYCFFFIN